MRFLVLLVLVVAMLLSGAPQPREKHYTLPNAPLFFANNDDYYEAFSSVAVAICIQDKAQDDSPQAWTQAAKVCRDSRTDEQGDSISQDGEWRKFVWQAIDVITQMCKANAAKLCGSFK